MNIITATWWNGCFGKMDDHPVHTIPNHHHTNVDVLPKTYAQINFAAKSLLRHTSTYILKPTVTTFAFSSVFILHL